MNISLSFSNLESPMTQRDISKTVVNWSESVMAERVWGGGGGGGADAGGQSIRSLIRSLSKLFCSFFVSRVGLFGLVPVPFHFQFGRFAKQVKRKI